MFGEANAYLQSRGACAAPHAGLQPANSVGIAEDREVEAELSLEGLAMVTEDSAPSTSSVDLDLLDREVGGLYT